MGFKGVAMGGAKHDGGVTVHEAVSREFVCCIGDLQNSPLFEGGVLTQGARHKEALNTSLAV